MYKRQLLEYLYKHDKELVGAWPYQVDMRFAAERNFSGIPVVDGPMPEPAGDPNDVMLPNYRYAGDDPIKRLVYETITSGASEQKPSKVFGLHAVQLIDQYTDCLLYTSRCV